MWTRRLGALHMRSGPGRASSRDLR
jgi:hypothetical protein